MTSTRRAIAIVPLAAALCAVPAVASAQQQRPARPPTRAGQPIVIRGQVPTPQVVTVRPRAVPEYRRDVLDPGTGARWLRASVLSGYRLVIRRDLDGRVPPDTMPATPGGRRGARAGPVPTPDAPVETTRTPQRTPRARDTILLPRPSLEDPPR